MARLNLAVIFFTLLFGVAYIYVLRMAVQKNLLTKTSLLFWFGASLVLFVNAVYPTPIFAATDWLGFEVPANGIFFLAIGFLMFLNLVQSLEISKLEKMIYRLTQDFAIRDLNK